MVEPEYDDAPNRRWQRLPARLSASAAAPAVAFLAFIALAAASGPAAAQEIFAASPDVTLALGTADVVTTDEDVALDDQLGTVALESLGSLPGSAEVTGYGMLPGNVHLMALDTTAALSGGVVARPGDVVAWDGATHAMLFDASANGVPAGIRTDATSYGSGGLLLSFDSDVDLGGLVVADEDLVYWTGGGFTLAFDGSAQGVDPRLDVDAAQDPLDGSFLMSFDASGVVGGIVFDDEDVLRFDGSSWSLEIDASALDSDWAAADLGAEMVPEPGRMCLLAAGVAFLAASRTAARVPPARADSRHESDAPKSSRRTPAADQPAPPARWHCLPPSSSCPRPYVPRTASSRSTRSARCRRAASPATPPASRSPSPPRAAMGSRARSPCRRT